MSGKKDYKEPGSNLDGCGSALGCLVDLGCFFFPLMLVFTAVIVGVCLALV